MSEDVQSWDVLSWDVLSWDVLSQDVLSWDVLSVHLDNFSTVQSYLLFFGWLDIDNIPVIPGGSGPVCVGKTLLGLNNAVA